MSGLATELTSSRNASTPTVLRFLIAYLVEALGMAGFARKASRSNPGDVRTHSR
jgi:hypothetical protein